MANIELYNVVDSMDLKLSARISKSKLKRLIREFTVFSMAEPTSVPQCNTCKYQGELCLSRRYCLRTDEIIYTKFIKEETDTNVFKLNTSKDRSFRLTKSAIKQFILYHFLPEDKDLLRKGITYSNLAKLCGVTPATAKSNQKQLEEIGFAFSKKSSVAKNRIDIMIKDEFRIHESKDENIKTQGYITISLEILKSLLSIENVSLLKTEISKLLHADYKTSKVGEHIGLNKENLTEMLPSYLTKWKKKCLEIISSTKSLLPLKGDSLDTTKFAQDKQYLKELKTKIALEVNAIFEKHNCPFSKDYGDKLGKLESLSEMEIYAGYKSEYENQLKKIQLNVIMDIASLAMQYGKCKVLKALEQMISEYSTYDYHTNQTIFAINIPGAYLRSAIRASFTSKGCLI